MAPPRFLRRSTARFWLRSATSLASVALDLLREIDKAVPAEVDVHCIANNCTPHSHPKINAWQATRPHWHMHVTPDQQLLAQPDGALFPLIIDRAIRRGLPMRSTTARVRSWQCPWPCIGNFGSLTSNHNIVSLLANVGFEIQSLIRSYSWDPLDLNPPPASLQTAWHAQYHHSALMFFCVTNALYLLRSASKSLVNGSPWATEI